MIKKLLIALALGAVLCGTTLMMAIRSSSYDQATQSPPTPDNPASVNPGPPRGSGETLEVIRGYEGVTEERPAGQAQSLSAQQCRVVIREAVKALGRFDDKRLKSIRISVDEMESYRGLGIAQLEPFARQGDADAMIVLAFATMANAVGLGDTNAVPLALGEIDEDDAFGSVDLARDHAAALKSAAEWLYEAGIHGRLTAFSQVGSLLEALTPVELGWLTAEDWEALTPEQQRVLNPNAVYVIAYYLLDPDLWPSNSSAPYTYEEWLAGRREVYGSLFDEIIQPLADGFLEDIAYRGGAMPDIPPPRSVDEYLESNGSECRREQPVSESYEYPRRTNQQLYTRHQVCELKVP